MNQIRALLSLELKSFCGINKFLHTNDEKHKKRYKILAIVWAFLIVMASFYIGGLVYGLTFLGLAEIVPAYLTVLSSALIIFFGIFSAGNRIFGKQGYDMLVSMPIIPRSIVVARFISLYISEFFLTAAIFIPGIAVYGYFAKPNIIFYLLSVVIMLFVPLIPLVISVLLGSIVLAITSRMKNKSIAQSVLSVLLVVGVMGLSFNTENIAENLNAEQFANLAHTINNIFANVYPPAIWVNRAIINFDFPQLLLFAAVSVFAAGIIVFIISKNYAKIVRGLLNFNAKHNYKIGRMESRGILKALCFREAKRYFASSTYVTNTIVGPILGVIMSVAVCVAGLDKIKSLIPLPIDIPRIFPFVLAAVFCTMTITSVSISMEGKQFWVIKSLPVSAKNLFDSKIIFNLSVILPFFAVSQIVLAIALKPSITDLLWQISIPLAIILCAVVFGITANLLSHSFDWEQEASVVKQSLSAAVGGFAGPILSILLIVVMFIIPQKYDNAAKSVILIALLFFTALLYRSNNKHRLIDL